MEMPWSAGQHEARDRNTTMDVHVTD